MEDTQLRSAPYNPTIEHAAQQAHQRVDRIADKAVFGVGRASDSAHRVVNTTADKAAAAADWASQVPVKARRAQGAMTEAAGNSIRARPLSAVVGAVAAGYVLGRIARW
ncbi:MAG: hypothetical protein ABI900_03795 [Betaproteobacteria bacterium]